MANHRFCSECGTEYTNLDWPKVCNNCNFMMWKNPTPVATILQPVAKDGQVGLLILRRAIEPKLGEWNLPGGFMEDNGESAEDGALRELYEETGLKIGSKPKIIFSEANLRGQLIIMSESTEIWNYEKNVIKLCRENSDYKVAWEPEPLAFPIQTRAMEDWFYRLERAKRFCYTKDDIKHLSVVDNGDGTKTYRIGKP